MNYSQNNEQEVILDYFKGKIGTFIDIGANDGVTLSNTRALALSGWKGVLVEPSPQAFALLKENYKDHKAYIYNVALGDKNEKQKLFDSGKHLTDKDHGLLSTMVPQEKKRWINEKFEDVYVKCQRWKTFLNMKPIKEFDFISMDIEGMELDWVDENGNKRDGLLKQIDLRTTSLVCLEWNSKPQVKAEFDKLMIGFNIIYTSPENLIYAR